MRAQAYQLDRTFLHSHLDGNVLATHNHNIDVEEQFSAPYLLLHRASLQRVLRERAEDLGARLLLNSTIVDMDLDTKKPSIRLHTGEYHEADIILGADGERSFCREQLLGREDPLHGTGNLVYRLTIPASEVQQREDLADLAHPANVNLWMGPGSHAVTYVVKHDSLLNVALTVPQASHDKTQYGLQRATIPEIRDALQGWDSRFLGLLNLAQDCAKWSLLQAREIENWTHPNRRFALIGDAAHAMVPSL